MTTKIIGIIQVKGGAGRSTVSTTLAGELSKLGRTVLIDCDMPQGTSASWFAVREQAGNDGNLLLETATTYKDLIAKVQRHQERADFIVLDGPPRIAELTRAILILADLCIVPVGASAAEIWATSDLLPLLKEASKISTVNAYLLWTRHRPRTKLATALQALSDKELCLPVLNAALNHRVAYPQALGSGLTVAELQDATAAAEALALTTEVINLP